MIFFFTIEVCAFNNAYADMIHFRIIQLIVSNMFVVISNRISRIKNFASNHVYNAMHKNTLIFFKGFKKTRFSTNRISSAFSILRQELQTCCKKKIDLKSSHKTILCK